MWVDGRGSVDEGAAKCIVVDIVEDHGNVSRAQHLFLWDVASLLALYVVDSVNEAGERCQILGNDKVGVSKCTVERVFLILSTVKEVVTVLVDLFAAGADRKRV